MEDSSERSPLLRLFQLFFPSSSLARIYAYSDFGIILSLFHLRAALGWSPLTLHCSFSLLNLARSSSLHVPIRFLSLFLSPPSFALSLACAACFPLHESPFPTFHGPRPALYAHFSLCWVVVRVGQAVNSTSDRCFVSRRVVSLRVAFARSLARLPRNETETRFVRVKTHSTRGKKTVAGGQHGSAGWWSGAFRVKCVALDSAGIGEQVRRLVTSVGALDRSSFVALLLIVIAPLCFAPLRPVACPAACHSSRDTDIQDHRLSERTVDQPSGRATWTS